MHGRCVWLKRAKLALPDPSRLTLTKALMVGVCSFRAASRRVAGQKPPTRTSVTYPIVLVSQARLRKPQHMGRPAARSGGEPQMPTKGLPSSDPDHQCSSMSFLFKARIANAIVCQRTKTTITQLSEKVGSLKIGFTEACNVPLVSYPPHVHFFSA